MSLRYNVLTGRMDFDTKPTNQNFDQSLVQKDYTAGEDLSALRMVINDNPTTVSLADKDTLNEAQTIGMAINAALTGNDVTVVTFGQVDDASFTYAANQQLFLDNNGAITDIAPTTGHNVPIGRGMGAGSIFIDIDELTIL